MAEVYAGRVTFFAVLLAFCFLQEGNSTREWLKEDFPNPTKNLVSCGRRGKVSWICDPDKVLSYETADKVEELLYSIGKNTASECSSDEKAGFQIGVAVLKKMRTIPGESVEETAEKFTKHLHDSWGVGHASCDDGAMLLLSILDRQVHVSTGKKAMELLSDDQIGIIIEEMKTYLRGKDYDKSVELAVVRMGDVFSGKVLKRPFNDVVGFICLFLIVLIGHRLEPPSFVKRLFTMVEGWVMRLFTMVDRWGSKIYRGRVVPKPDFGRSSMVGGGSFGSGGGFGGGGSAGGGGMGGSW